MGSERISRLFYQIYKPSEWILMIYLPWDQEKLSLVYRVSWWKSQQDLRIFIYCKLEFWSAGGPTTCISLHFISLCYHLIKSGDFFISLLYRLKSSPPLGTISLGLTVEVMESIPTFFWKENGISFLILHIHKFYVCISRKFDIGVFFFKSIMEYTYKHITKLLWKWNVHNPSQFFPFASKLFTKCSLSNFRQKFKEYE